MSCVECSNGCTTSCRAGCAITCADTCSNNCSNSCADSCEYGCTDVCTGDCSSTCSNGCGGSCVGQCADTCLGSCVGGCVINCAFSASDTDSNILLKRSQLNAPGIDQVFSVQSTNLKYGEPMFLKSSSQEEYSPSNPTGYHNHNYFTIGTGDKTVTDLPKAKLIDSEIVDESVYFDENSQAQFIPFSATTTFNTGDFIVGSSTGNKYICLHDDVKGAWNSVKSNFKSVPKQINTYNSISDEHKQIYLTTTTSAITDGEGNNLDVLLNNLEEALLDKDSAKYANFVNAEADYETDKIYIVGIDPSTPENSKYYKLKYRPVNENGNTTNDDGIYFNAQTGVLYGSAWNDFAELRKCNEIPGTCVRETGKGNLVMTSERLQRGACIVSDTYGMLIGPRQEDTRPIAIAGRVLAYSDMEYTASDAGCAVCSGPNGTVSKMTDKEIKEYPDRIIGYISEIPEYETWQNCVRVDNRIWVKVK